MAKYKAYSYSQGVFIPVHFDHQIQPGTFEYTLSHIIDSELDLSIFDCRFKNDETGAPAFDPAVLLKYSAGRLLAGNYQQPPDCKGLRRERGVHGPVSRYPPGLHYDCRFCGHRG